MHVIVMCPVHVSSCDLTSSGRPVFPVTGKWTPFWTALPDPRTSSELAPLSLHVPPPSLHPPSPLTRRLTVGGEERVVLEEAKQEVVVTGVNYFFLKIALWVLSIYEYH